MSGRPLLKMIRLPIVILLCLCQGCAVGTGASENRGKKASLGDRPPREKKVILLVIDGLRDSEGFGDPSRAHVRRLWNVLRPKGTVITNFRNEGLTTTNPGHTSILTGTWQNVANDGSERPDQPTLFEYYRKRHSLPTEAAYVISGKSKLGICSHSTHPDYGRNFTAAEKVGYVDDRDVYSALVAVLKTKRPRLVLACFPGVDVAGHSGIWTRYIDAIETADSLSLELWNFIESDPFYGGDTYLIITNDHGRHDDQNGGFKDHGDGCEGCRKIMFLALGPGIPANRFVNTAYTQRDICNTVGVILDFAVPNSHGVAIAEIFEPVPAGSGSPGR